MSQIATTHADHVDASTAESGKRVASDKSEAAEHVEGPDGMKQDDVPMASNNEEQEEGHEDHQEEVVEQEPEEKVEEEGRSDHAVKETTTAPMVEAKGKEEAAAAKPANTKSLWGGGLFGALVRIYQSCPGLQQSYLITFKQASTTRSIANLSTQSTFIPTVVKDKPAAAKPKGEIKALHAAAQAAKKVISKGSEKRLGQQTEIGPVQEQQERERRAQQKEMQAERQRLAMKRKEEEDQRRAEELRKKEEEKNKRVEGLLAQKRQVCRVVDTFVEPMN